jgi:hypothetical protein
MSFRASFVVCLSFAIVPFRAHSAEPDLDGDGWTADLDCDDFLPGVHPGAVEWCDGIDDNCDDLVDLDDPALVGTAFYDDVDRDGYGDDATADATGCAPLPGYVSVGGDCDATDVATHPNAPEICDGEDNDCDGAVDESTVKVDWYFDADNDGYGTPSDVVRACAMPPGYARGRGDCDDSDSAVSPLEDETCGNTIDDNCDGAIDNCSQEADDVADVVIQSSEVSWFGAALTAGDLDGDGVADLLVGAPYANRDHGGVFAFLGPEVGTLRTDEAWLTVSGAAWPAAESKFGAALAYGDTNGDGYDDLVVGTPYTAAKVYVFFGPLTSAATGADADAVYSNVCAYGTAAGTAVEVLSDYDGDGIPAVAIGQPATGSPFQDGLVYVVSGALTGSVDLHDDFTYRFRSGDRDRGGNALTALDANGDGLDELVFGAPRGGAAYVVERPDAPGSYPVPENAVATFLGYRPGLDDFGWDVASSDLDGDGYPDAIVAAPRALTAYGQSTGAVFAFLGPLSGTTSAAAANARWEGEADQTNAFGYSVATGGDVDGDGEIDVLIGDPYQREADRGAVYLQLGTPRGVISSDLLTAFRSDEWDWFGATVAFTPDWSGDGLPEITAGAVWAPDDAGVQGGRVSVFFSDSLFE